MFKLHELNKVLINFNEDKVSRVYLSAFKNFQTSLETLSTGAEVTCTARNWKISITIANYSVLTVTNYS